MNRTIKFCGKRIDNGQWVYGDLVQCDHDILILPINTGWTHHKVIPETVGQFIGLLDKNGKEIWEGDIFKEDNSGIVRSVFRVPGGLAFEDNPVSFGYDHRVPVYPYSSIAEMQNVSWLSQCCEVIGNIHDNPELLNTK